MWGETPAMRGPASSPAVLAKFVQRAQQLYSLPGVAMRVLELTRSSTVDVREIQQCVEADPALVGKLLRVVNSSLFGLSKPVADLNQAIALLGIQRLKMLVLGFSLPTQSASSAQPAVLERYWKHALLKSVASRELAESLWKIPSDEAFIAGLLQDIGLLVLVQDLGDSYVKFLHGAWTVGNEPRDMEVEVLGFDHVELSAKLLEEWGLPGPLLKAIASPRDRESLSQLHPRDRVLPQILDLAELVTRFLLYRQQRWLDNLLETGDAYLGLTVEQLHVLFTQLEKKAPQFAAALAMPWKDETQYVRLLQEARQRQTAALQAVTPPDLLEPAKLKEFASSVDLSDSADPVPPKSSASTRPQRGRQQADAPLKTISASPPQCATTTLVATKTTSSLSQQLSTAVANCRQSRMPLSLALVQLDQGETAKLRFGPQNVPELMQDIKAFIGGAADGDHGISTVPVSESRLAVIMSGLDRQQAIAVGRDILETMRDRSGNDSNSLGNLSVSIGLASLAMPPRNFPVLEMVQAAERCLHGVQLSGGDGFKSIEMC